ncbi:transcription antitermination factor NusB [Gemmatimonadota bacterium]
MLRTETKTRARALQLLYAWELHGKPPIQQVAGDLAALSGRWIRGLAAAETKAAAVSDVVSSLDDEISQAADNWRLDRIGVIERNILRLAVHEMDEAEVPPRVTISEAIRLAHWFAGEQSPSFVNGVLDGIARNRGNL